jgi:hypothetical protein
MKRISVICGVLLAMTATVASAAQGLNLRWDQCLGDGGVLNKPFACDSNTAPVWSLVGSFELDRAMPMMSGVEPIVDITASGAALPAWWQFKAAGTCRQLSLSYVTSGGGVACPDWASGQSWGGLGSYDIGVHGPNTARIRGVSAVPQTAIASLLAGREYYLFNITINSAGTVGNNACGGCNTGVCIVFTSALCRSPNGHPFYVWDDRMVTGPTNSGDSNFAMWQGGDGGAACGPARQPASLSRRNTTWRALKSLYR